MIVAMDRSKARLKPLASASTTTGLSGVLRVAPGDLREYARWVDAKRSSGSAGDAKLPLVYDKVLVDAPCSGTGVLAKRADLRWRRTPEQLVELCTLQDELLAAAAMLVRPGGLLVYSTCSIEPEEHAGRIEAFLARHARGGEWCVEAPPAGLLPQEVVTPEGYATTLPHVHGTDGAFAVRFRRLDV